jgi:hypothetical protein
MLPRGSGMPWGVSVPFRAARAAAWRVAERAAYLATWRAAALAATSA